MTCDVRIDLVAPGVGRVYIDGIEIKQVRRIEFDVQPGHVAQVTLTLIPRTVEVTGLADVALREAKLG